MQFELLNSDDVGLTDTLREWLLRCVFKEPAILDYAEEKLRSVKVDSVRQFNRRLLEAASEPMSEPVLDLEFKFRAAILDHLQHVHRNEQAYQTSKQDCSKGGIWPNPTNEKNRRSLYTELPYVTTNKFIDRSTPVSSAGSCFATEIAHQLQADGFNYVIAERNRSGSSSVTESAPVDASATWGIIFNTPSLRQLVERAFGLRETPKILWCAELHGDGRNVFMDPFREGMEFASPEEYLADYRSHLVATRAALTAAEVFIVTLGLNEVWTFRMDGSVFSRSPWQIAPSFVEYQVLTVEQNVAELQRMLTILRRFRPGIKVIVTLSPIPLHATFLHLTAHIVEANTHSKAVLRVAAQQFADGNPDVFYFPSYELITTSIHDPWDDDQRHVKRSSVARAMQMFKEMYVKDQDV